MNLVNPSNCYSLVRFRVSGLGPNQWRIISNLKYVEIKYSFRLKLKKKDDFFSQ